MDDDAEDLWFACEDGDAAWLLEILADGVDNIGTSFFPARMHLSLFTRLFVAVAAAAAAKAVALVVIVVVIVSEAWWW